ncbi:hypothetical protein MERGE_001771 [Pneumocystis wakefieldiae]|uniref:TBP-associated factor 12 n=1 Tax=Pneumocystis wakefieldiae TaxID=38082 RepID=A0A899FKA1_9ASCO|nr:hypothetical protein MERGE_001771 [Pneumocystis wakefieldiae]
MSQLQDLQAQITKYEQAAQQAGLQTPQGQALYQNVCRLKQKLLSIQNGSGMSVNVDILKSQGLRPGGMPINHNLKQALEVQNHLQQTTQHLVKVISELKEQLGKIKAELSKPNISQREKEELEKEHNEKVAALNTYHLHIQKATQQFHQMQQIQSMQGQENAMKAGSIHQASPMMQKVPTNQIAMNMTLQQRASMQQINSMAIQQQQISQANKNKEAVTPTMQQFRQNPVNIPRLPVQPATNLAFQSVSGQIVQNSNMQTSFEKMPPISEVINVKAPVPMSIPPSRPTLTSGYTTTPFMSTPGISRPPQHDTDNGNRILSKRKLQELVKQINPDERLDPDVEELLLEVADEFVESVVSFACRLAKYRKSDTLDVKDVQLHLERNWNIRIPGYTSDEIRSVRKNIPCQAYQQKQNAIATAKSMSKE